VLKSEEPAREGRIIQVRNQTQPQEREAPSEEGPGVIAMEGAVTPATREQQEAAELAPRLAQETSLGPYPVDRVGLLSHFLGISASCPFKIYGWLDGGYTYRSTGTGPTFVAPVMNRFGDEFLLNQIAFRIEKRLEPNAWSWGFNMQPYGGSDPSLLNPTRGAIIPHPDPRFGFDFSDLNLTAHIPLNCWFCQGGVDIKAGRQTTVLGSQAAQAPWRYFYSSDYQWFLAEEGRFTGVTANFHVNKLTDWYIGYEMGWGTLFTNLSLAPTLITQLNHFLHPDKRTLLTMTVVTGPESPGNWQNTTVVEGRVTQNWCKQFTQILQTHLGYSGNGIAHAGIERFFSVYLYNSYHVNPIVDFNTRLEWYDDVDGHGYPGGSGFKNNYYEVTAGFNYHPHHWLEIRPEIRGDFADQTPAFGATDHPKSKDQLSLACDFLIKF
jgi:hypothetical protein